MVVGGVGSVGGGGFVVGQLMGGEGGPSQTSEPAVCGPGSTPGTMVISAQFQNCSGSPLLMYKQDDELLNYCKRNIDQI